MECLSHPQKLLVSHLTNVFKIGSSIYNNYKPNFYTIIEDNILEHLLRNILLLHDFGKATIFFQKYLKSKIENSNQFKYEYHNELKNHGLISALYASYDLFVKFQNTLLSLVCFIIIYKHHGDLDDVDELLYISDKHIDIVKIQYENVLWDGIEDLSLVRYQWNEISEYAKDIWIFNQDLLKHLYNFILFKYFYSLLLYSDKNEAIFSKVILNNKNFDNPDKLIDNYKKKYFNNRNSSKLKNKINLLREEIYVASTQRVKEYDNIPNIVFLNIPTGLGKTLTGFNIAFQIMKNNPIYKKVIYAAPFISIIDQIEQIINEILNVNNLNILQHFLVHHHLVEPSIQYDENSYTGYEGQFLIENWDKPIIVTTFWQLFYTIFGNDNKINRKFHNLVNSIIILDEIQSVPYKYWYTIKETLKLLSGCLNCKIIYMTATLPLIFSIEESQENSLIKDFNKNIYDIINDRFTIKIINNLKQININELKNYIEDVLNCNNNILIVVNTIRESRIIYDLVNNIKHNDDILYYLSTSVLPVDRTYRINALNRSLKKTENRIILVSTQLIEAGVDLDFDIVFRDLAPFDSIIQSAGRCNRNAKNQGIVYLFNLIDSNSINNRSFYSYIYNDSVMVPTKELLSSRNQFSESELIDLLKLYYTRLQDIGSDATSNEMFYNLCNLKFKTINNTFELIENKPEQLLFIEKDDNASSILIDYKNIKHEYTGFEFYDHFLKIKRSFFEYVISVKISTKTIGFLQSFEDIGNFYLLNKEMSKQYYDSNLGLVLEFDNFI